MKLLVTTGHRKSRYTLALLSELIKIKYFQIECVEVSTINIKRFRKYLLQYGYKTLVKKFLINLSDKVENEISNETLPIKNHLRENNIPFVTIKSFCSKNKIKHYITKNLNSQDFINKICNGNIDLVIYSGGGILRKKFIDIPKIGVLNAHSGFLPNFRGMNAIEWSILENFKPHTTLHLIDSGIDTGPVLFSEQIPFSNDLYMFRGNAVVHNLKLMVKVLQNFEDYLKNLKFQKKESGKQYYVMHKVLKKVVQERLKISE